MQKLAGIGMFGKVNSTLLATLTSEQADLLRQEMGARGTSLESSVIKDCRDRYKRAKQLGYENVEDRYASDVTFCDQMHEEGRGLNDCIFDDMFAFANLPDPLRSRIQISAGVAANAEHQNCLSKLIYMSQPRGVEGFPVEYRGTWTKVWGFMFGRHIFNEEEYTSAMWVAEMRTEAFWKGIVTVPFDGTQAFLDKVYEENLPLVRGNLERKEKQSAAAKAGGPGGQKADPTVEPTAERKRKAEADASATATGFETTAASSSAQADASSGATPFLSPDPPAQRAEQDLSWSPSRRQLHQRQPALQRQRHQAPVARMPLGVGIVIAMVPAVNGVSGVERGITEMRPAADGSEPIDSNDLCSFCARCGMVNCLPCFAATGFTEAFQGTFEMLCKIQKPNKNNLANRKVVPFWLFGLYSCPCSPEGSAKTPAVKP